MAQAKRDNNQVTTLLAVSNADGTTPVVLYADPTTHRLLVSATVGALDDLSDVVITSGAQGDILYFNGTNWVNLAAGTSGYFLKTQGAGANPTWDAAAAANITVANEATDTTCFPVFVTAATGSLPPKTNAGLTFNSNTGMLTATGLTGPLTGNASTATALQTARTIGGTSFDGTANIVPATITVADTTDATCFVALFESATGDLAPKTDLGLAYAADTGTLTATAFSGPLTGNVTGNVTGTSGSTTGNAASITVADEASDTTCFIGFYTAASGSLPGKTNTNMTFNASTGVATFASVVLTTADINGGTLDGTSIGASSPSTGVFTTLVAGSTTSLLLGTAGSAVGNIGFRNATSGTITLAPVTGALGTVTLTLPAATDTVAVLAATQTFTNKRITQRVVTTTDDATAVIDVDVTDTYQLSAVANNTEFTVTGTPTDGQKLIVRYKDAGVSKTLTWTFATAIGVTLPAATTAGKWGYVGCVYNSAASQWHAVAVNTQA